MICAYHLSENKTIIVKEMTRAKMEKIILGPIWEMSNCLEQNKFNEIIGVRVCGWKIMEFMECLVRDMCFGLCSTNSNPLKAFEQRAAWSNGASGGVILLR